MKLVKKYEGVTYAAPAHFGNWAMRKFGKPEGAKRLALSVSEFFPGGGAEMSVADKERLYYVLRGHITVHTKDGTAYEMDEGDTIYIPAGEERDMIATGETAARCLVILGFDD